MLVSPQEVVARVKIPPPLLFQVMRNLAGAQDQYEAMWGKIPHLREDRPSLPVSLERSKEMPSVATEMLFIADERQLVVRVDPKLS